MTREELIRLVTRQVLDALRGNGPAQAEPLPAPRPWRLEPDGEGCLPDPTSRAFKNLAGVGRPENPEALAQMKRRTPARIGVGKAGARLRTGTLLALRADHAGARDAVFRDVDEDILRELDLFSVQTLCQSRNEHLTRPDLGRRFSPETIRELRAKCQLRPRVQIYVSDGLSSGAVDANIRDLLPVLLDGLQDFGISTGTPFFVRFGRVPAMDAVSETLEAEVTCVLLGERPGLATANSMSAYIAYKAAVGMPEARRTVVSNIHSGGIPAVEAGAHIAEVIKIMLERKQSGVDLQL